VKNRRAVPLTSADPPESQPQIFRRNNPLKYISAISTVKSLPNTGGTPVLL